jgi:nucleotide-binding universal stress UspA family protein
MMMHVNACRARMIQADFGYAKEQGGWSMTYRVIGCVMTGGTDDRAALASAFALADADLCHVRAFFLAGDPKDAMPMLSENLSAAWMQGVAQALEDEHRQRLGQARTTFEAACRERHVMTLDRPPDDGRVGASAHWREIIGMTEGVMAEGVRTCDAIVFPSLARQNYVPLTVSLETALLEGGRPLLIAPSGGLKAPPRRLAIAWNGKVEATRAVAMALPLLHRAEEVQILTAGDGAADALHSRTLQDYLCWHGIRAVARHVPDGGNVAAALRRACAEADVELLIMGGYGHSRLRQLVLGGVTRDLLDQDELGLLMAH